MSDIDFHRVEPGHRAIDSRLKNWAAWCKPRHASLVCPMFRMMPPPPRVRSDLQLLNDYIDGKDAQEIQKAVVALPDLHRAAIGWSYVNPSPPRRAAKVIGTTLSGLALLVRDGRQMLVNRGF